MVVIEEKELKDFLDHIRKKYGYDFTEYAPASIKRRINSFMVLNKVARLDELQSLLLTDEIYFERFIRDLSVTVTEMFRDPTFFKSMREKVVKRLATYPVIKIWVAGCATGEEVYSLAIMLKEEGLLERCIIYATDINQESLRIARDGIYPLENMKTYSVNYMKSGGYRPFSEYYVSKYQSVIFDQSLKQNIVFAPHNLVTDKSFNEFQLIVCRNVLIYFNQSLQNKVLNLFHDSLCLFGFLALGSKESLLFTDRKKCFRETDAKEKIFMKVSEP